MTESPKGLQEFTITLEKARAGDQAALDRLVTEVYEELRGMAERHLGRERPGHTLQATALVHEAYVRLVGEAEHDWRRRSHFFASAAVAIRRILVDHARRRGTLRRGGDRERVAFDLVLGDIGLDDQQTLELNDALERLADRDAVAARVVELRFFGGLTAEESAHVLDISVPTANRKWRMARAWIKGELGP